MTASLTSTPDHAAEPRFGTIAHEAERRLRFSGYLALQSVSCDGHAETLRLRGRLPTYFLKHVAQAIVSEIEGVCRIVNLIDVDAPNRRR